MKRVAILQSNYIPWKGYFDLIAFVDEFIVYDEVQYTRRDWRNRNLIKTPQGLKWLTVPVRAKSRYTQRISETEIDGDDWAASHWKSLELNYRGTPHFESVAERLKLHYEHSNFTLLSDLNQSLLLWACSELGIKTTITRSRDYDLVEGRTERLVDICRQAGAGEYVSGPAARDYLDESQFAEQGMRVCWFDYSGYPRYPQRWGEFEHGVSIVDLLFNTGPEAPAFMKHVAP